MLCSGGFHVKAVLRAVFLTGHIRCFFCSYEKENPRVRKERCDVSELLALSGFMSQSYALSLGICGAVLLHHV